MTLLHRSNQSTTEIIEVTENLWSFRAWSFRPWALRNLWFIPNRQISVAVSPLHRASETPAGGLPRTSVTNDTPLHRIPEYSES